MLVYGALASAAVWLGAVPWTLTRAVTGRLAAGELRERLGHTHLASSSRRPILIHGVSAGEMVSARALVEALVRRDATIPIVLTTGTSDGRTIAQRVHADLPHAVECAFLPWDRPRVMRRWLARLKPRAVVIMETELWPGLFAACRTSGVPLLIVSGRLYPRDVGRYQWLRPWWSTVMAMPTRILAQDAHEAEAFGAIGAPAHLVEVGGNLKFDAVRAVTATRPASSLNVVAGSTHPPEETWILDAVARVQHAGVPCTLTLAPRDVTRAAAVRRRAVARGVTDVTVLDRMGTLAHAYASAHVALCGGTLTTWGGHNIIEPAAAGCAPVVGPHAGHITRLVEDLDAAGGLIRVTATDPASLVASIAETLIGLHRDRSRLDLIGRRAAAWSQQRRGAADRAAALILTGLSPSSTCS